jgi:hypothetical protein
MPQQVLSVTDGKFWEKIDKIRFVGYAFQIEMKYRTFAINSRLLRCQLFYR